MSVKTILEHTDDILALPNGAWVIAAEPVKGCSFGRGALEYAAGSRFRVKYGIAAALYVLDEQACAIYFERAELAHLERDAL